MNKDENNHTKKETQEKYCIRCGMPLAKDDSNRGTEKNGSLSSTFCNNCYVNGEVLNPDITKQEMYILTMETSKKDGKNAFLRMFFWLVYPFQLNHLPFWDNEENQAKVKRKYSKDDVKNLEKKLNIKK